VGTDSSEIRGVAMDVEIGVQAFVEYLGHVFYRWDVEIFVESIIRDIVWGFGYLPKAFRLKC